MPAEGANRAVFEHAIAALVGKMPAELRLEVEKTPPRRADARCRRAVVAARAPPDISSAERGMQSANAQIGVAVAAYYPQFTFDASITFLSTMLSNLLQIANAVWSLGPSLAGTAIDGGARAAQVEGARAGYDRAVATYRQTVVVAFQQVEDALAQQRYFSLQEDIQRRAVASALEAERLSLNQYQAGTVAYTTVITAQTTALSAQQTLINIRLNRFATSATLVTALGGGWREQDLPTADAGHAEDCGQADAGAEELVAVLGTAVGKFFFAFREEWAGTLTSLHRRPILARLATLANFPLTRRLRAADASRRAGDSLLTSQR